MSGCFFVNIVTEMTVRNIAQRYAILFCVKLSNNVTTTHGKLQQAFGGDATSGAKPFAETKFFLKARNLVEDEQCSGVPSATRTGDNTARLRELVQCDRVLTVRVIADEVSMNRKAVRLILT